MLKEDIIIQLYDSPNPEKLKELKKQFSQKNKLKDLPTNISLLHTYRELVKQNKIQANSKIEKTLKKRWIRSQSWIVAVQVLTKPFPCPGKCIFCPNDPEMPKSYIKTEPWAMRALLNQFDPIKQVYNRLKSLTLSGHETDKIEMIVLWGTRDVYPDKYKIEFIKWLYDACNSFNELDIEYKWLDETDENKRYKYTIKNQNQISYSKNIDEAIQINEQSKHRIIGLTIETRLEMWVQSMYDKVLKANKRWHGVQEIEQACHKLRQYGFKFSIHIMPGLYKSSIRKDIKTVKKIYENPFIKPDEIKFYPTSVIPNTELFQLYQKGKYKAIKTKDIEYIVEKMLKEIVPPYSRIKRLIRDIPATEITAGSNITNLNQLIHTKLQKQQNLNPKSRKKFFQRLYYKFQLYDTVDDYLSDQKDKKKKSLGETSILTSVIWQAPNLLSPRNFVSLDTRSREIRNRTTPHENTANLVIREYKSSIWSEFFISFEDSLWYLFGFCRLSLIQDQFTVNRDWLWKKTALIRELHVYWKLQSLNKDKKRKAVQHSGFGKQLMQIAEQITVTNDYHKISVISGIGVREYYQKIWYKKEWTYMTKLLV